MRKNLYTSVFLVAGVLVSGCKTTSRNYEPAPAANNNSTWLESLRALSEALEEPAPAPRYTPAPAPRQPAQPQTYRAYQQPASPQRPAAPAAPRYEPWFGPQAQPQAPQQEDPAIAESRRRQRADIERRQLEEATRNSMRTFAEEEARRNPAPAPQPQAAPAAWEPNSEDLRIAGIKLMEQKAANGGIAPAGDAMISYLVQHMNLPRDRAVIILQELGLVD